MKFHKTVVEELVKIYDIYGGHREDVKLRLVLQTLDLSVYKQQTSPHAEIIVLSRDIQSR